MAITLVINPLLAMNLSPGDYAIVGYYTSFNLLFTPIINFYLFNFYLKRYYELDEAGRRILKATIFKFLIFGSFVITCLCLGALYVYTRIFNQESALPFSPYAALALFSLMLTGVYTLQTSDYKIQGKSRAFFKISVSNGVINVLLSLLFVVIFRFGATGKLLAQFLAASVIFGWCLILNRRYFRYRFDWSILKNMLAFCWPLVIAAMLGFFSNGYDRVLLERSGDIRLLGIYVVAVQIAGCIQVFSNSINDTFQPDIFRSIVERDFRKCLKIIGVKLLSVSGIVIVFILFTPLIIYILTAGRYLEATPFARIIALSAVTSSLYYSFSQVTTAIGLTQITMVNKIIGSILCFLVYSILIPRYAFLGAAWSMVVSYIIFFLGNIVLLFIYRKRFLLQ